MWDEEDLTVLYTGTLCTPPPPPAAPVTGIWTNIERYLNSVYLYNGWSSTNLFCVLISVYIMWCTLHSLQITKRVIQYFLSWYEVDRIHIFGAIYTTVSIAMCLFCK